MYYKLSIWIFFCLSARFVFSQSIRGTAEERVSIKFSTLCVGSGEFEGICYFVGPSKLSKPLDFSLIKRGGQYAYTGSRQIQFVRTISFPTTEDPQAVTYELLAEASIPRGWQEVLFFFEALDEKESSKNNGMPYKVHLMEDSLESFPAGSLLVFNACGAPLVGSVGGQKDRYVGGPANPINFIDQPKKAIHCTFILETSEGPKIIFENRLEYSQRYRVILMLAPPRRKGSIRLEAYSIPQFVEENSSVSIN